MTVLCTCTAMTILFSVYVSIDLFYLLLECNPIEVDRLFVIVFDYSFFQLLNFLFCSEPESSFGVGQYVNDGACPLRLTQPGLDFTEASKALSEYQVRNYVLTVLSQNEL